MEKYVRKDKPNALIDVSEIAKEYAQRILDGEIDPTVLEFKTHLRPKLEAVGDDLIPESEAVFIVTAYWESDDSEAILGVARNFKKAKAIIENRGNAIKWLSAWHGVEADCHYCIEVWRVEE